ncbi:MAG TPA: hypothetical protein VFQ45_04095 [Longimicrobium sp.]|nr:hypothetical protein [Longimicrobium sp.]
MDDVGELLGYVVGVLEDLEIPYAIAGSVGAMAYGEVRGTTDLDVVVQIRAAGVPRLLERFPFPDFYVDLKTAQEAAASGGAFNIIYGHMKVDVFVASDELDLNQIRRARRLRTLGTEAQISPPEELIAKKLEYYDEGGSEKHLRDIAAMLRISLHEIDCERVSSYASQLHVTRLWEMVLKSLENVQEVS